MASEQDLMKGIDDKFQKLLSQFEMNMNILELKSKRYMSDDERSDTTQTLTESADPQEKHSQIKPEKNRNENDVNEIKEQKVNIKTGENRKETSKATKKEADSSQLANTKGQTVKKDLDKEQNANNPDSIGNILKYISDCAEIKSKRIKRKKKNISFIENEPVIPYNSDDSNKSQHSGRLVQRVKKAGAKKSPYGSEQLSKHGSKSKSDRDVELLRKCSKTVTNLSKKGKKRKTTRNTGSGKDWISYNRNNIAKAQKAQKAIKILTKTKDETDVQFPKRVAKKQDSTTAADKEPKSVSQVKAVVEHFETVENKLIKDLFNNGLSELTTKKEKNQINRFTIRDKTGFNKPVKPLKESTGNNSFINTDKNRINNKTADIKNIPEKKITNNEKVIPWQNMLRGRDVIKKPNEDRTQKFTAKSVSSDVPKAQKSDMIITKLEDKKSATSNLETKIQKERYKDHKMELEISKPKNEFKITPKYLNDFEDEEEQGDLGDGKVEFDEFFSEIPFVVGKSISRTYNLGLSFQHAMSLLRRMHNKKEVSSALSLGHPESVAGTESIHCLGLAHCEAMVGNSDWTKEDDEAWEENPWDPELNRRRPKCTCLPNNCTTLKNVLKQLTLKNPGFGRKSLQPSLSATSNKNLEAELFKKNALKKAQSQTRTELLRNIRTIQIQLTPSSEILK